MDVYNSLLGHEGKRVEPLVQSAEVIYEYLFGEKIKPEAPDRAISGPTPTFTMSSGSRRSKSGPRGRRIGPRNEEIEIDVMVKAAQIYALLALDICDRERPIRK